jgi:cell division protein FtsQ
VARAQTGRSQARRPGGVRHVGRRTPRQMPKIRLKAPTLPQNWHRYAIPAMVAIAIGTGGWFLYNSPLLEIQSVRVRGNTLVTTDLAKAASDLEGQSIFNPGFEHAEQSILLLPMVKDVNVSRDWPNGVTITITERAPWGVWQLGGVRYVVDEEGVVLDAEAPGGAPLVTQTDATVPPLRAGDRVPTGAMQVATQLVATAPQTLGRDVKSLEYTQRTGLTAFLTNDVGPDLRVVFGDAQGYDFKVASLFAVLQQAQEEGRVLSRVDLRFGERVAVQ